jgi:alpha-amylase
MSSICFYFQVHQPYRIKRFTYFDASKGLQYFDEEKNGKVMQKVAEKCYLPANQTMLKLIEKYDGDFRVAYSITGLALEQFKKYSPKTLDSFKALADTGCVEFLGETYYHSLASIYDQDEFRAQVVAHSDLIEECFGLRPSVFRNTELIFDDTIASMIDHLGFKGMIAEGADDILGWRSPHFVYTAGNTNIPLLVKNYRLSDDVAFRFSNRDWNQYPLNADTYARWIHGVSGAGDVVNLFMDYETFGEHQWKSTGIFDFLEHLPEKILHHPDWDFRTPAEALSTYPAVSGLAYPRLTSWADEDRDLTAWCGNEMQQKSLEKIYALGEKVRATKNRDTLDVWRKLQTSDHFYYMCTKWAADGDVHAYFSPFDGPYDAFLNYQNILKDFQKQIETVTQKNLAKSSPVETKTLEFGAESKPGTQLIKIKSGKIQTT